MLSQTFIHGARWDGDFTKVYGQTSSIYEIIVVQKLARVA